MNTMSEVPNGVSPPKTGIKGGASGTGISGSSYANSATSRNGHSNGKSNSSGSSKKKKRGTSRRRGENEIYKAADNSVNAQFKLESMLFPKASYVVKMPNSKGLAKSHPVTKDQFEDAAEAADRHLRQNRSDALGVGRPPFGYYSLHPSTLMLHPPHAVHHYYPATPMMFNSWMRSPPPFTPNSSSNTGQPQGSPHSSDLVMHHQHHNQQQNQQQQRHPSGVSPKVAQRSVAHHPGMPVHQQQQQQRPQQQQQQQQHQQHPPQAGGAAPGFLEFARKRQLQQQDHLRQQEALKMQQESLQQEQLRQNTMMGGQLQSRQQRPQSSPREKRHIEQLQAQQENTAAVLASMRAQPGSAQAASPATAARAAQMKLIPQAHGSVPSEQDSGRHLPARVALEACRKDPTAAAKFLGHLAQTKDGHPHGHHGHGYPGHGYPGHGRPYPYAVPHAAPPAQTAHQQQAAQQHRPIVPQPYKEQSRAPQPPQKSKITLPNQQHPKQPVLAPAASSEDALLDENGAGAKQFVKRMITSDEGSPLTTGMDQLETLPMLQYTPPDTKKEYPAREQEITNCDVLLGRGGMTNHHVGNMHFRTLVSSFRLHYCAAKKGDKGRLSKKLTNFVRHKNGRFLQKDDVDNLWYEVGDSRAHGKCAQALREGTADLNRQVANGAAFEPSTPSSDPAHRPPQHPSQHHQPPHPPPHSGPHPHHPPPHPHHPPPHPGHHMPSYPSAYAVRPPSSAPSPGGTPTPSRAARHHAHPHEAVHQGMMPRAAHHPHPQAVGAPGDQSSPRCVIRPPGDANSKNPTRAGQSPAPERPRPPQPQPPKWPLVKTPSSAQARKPAVAISSHGIRPERPAVMTDDEAPGTVDRQVSRKSSETRSENSGGQYDDDETTMEEEDMTAEDEASRKRMKVQHVEDEHFDYI